MIDTFVLNDLEDGLDDHVIWALPAKAEIRDTHTCRVRQHPRWLAEEIYFSACRTLHFVAIALRRARWLRGSRE